MKTSFSNIEYAKKASQQLTLSPPAISFEGDKKKEKEEYNKTNKDKYRTFTIKIEEGNATSETVEFHVKIFDTGTPEEYCKFAESYAELEKSMPLESPEKKKNVLMTLLKGDSITAFNTELAAQLTSRSGLTNEKVRKALQAVSLKSFKNDKSAYRRQVNYMRHHLYFTKTNFKAFELRLKEINRCLCYFPVPPGKNSVNILSDEELVEIIDQAKPVENINSSCLLITTTLIARPWMSIFSAWRI